MTTNKLLIKNKFLSKETIECAALSVCVFVIIFIILSDPRTYNSSVQQGLMLFAISVLPGLFPFMFLTKLLTGLGTVQKITNKFSKTTYFLFGTPGISGYVMFMSMLSGYPIGAKLISDLYYQNQISQQDAKKMVSFCTTSGPIFIIGTVGSIMYNSIQIGIILYFCHILSSVMCGIIFSGKRKKQGFVTTPLSTPTKIDNLLSSTMKDTVSNVLLVGGYITIFFLFSDILTKTGIIKTLSFPLSKLFDLMHLPNLSEAFFNGIIEVTKGIKFLSAQKSIFSVCLTSFLLSFSGISIILQSMAFLKKCKIKARYFIFVKCVHAILSCLLTGVCLLSFKVVL